MAISGEVTFAAWLSIENQAHGRKLKCQYWMPRYILMDQSNVEVNAINKAFPGLQAGERNAKLSFAQLIPYEHG